MGTKHLLALAVVAAAAGQPAASRSGSVQGIDLRVDGFRTASTLKLFPDDRNSPTVEAKEGMTLGIVTLSVVPSAGATVLEASDFGLSDASGARHDLVFTKLFNTCEGRRKQICDMPFNIPKNVKVTTLIVGSLKLSLTGLQK